MPRPFRNNFLQFFLVEFEARASVMRQITVSRYRDISLANCKAINHVQKYEDDVANETE